MSFFDKCVGLLAPHDCLGCAAEGPLLCEACSAGLPPADVPTPGDHLLRLQSATLYKGVAKDLIWKLKSGGAQAAATIMAQHMSKLIIPAQSVIIVPVPTATTRVRQRGYDQARLLAKALSRLTGLSYAGCLARHGQTHQVGAHRHERLKQLEGALRVTKPSTVRGSHIILVDDVTTTGATLESAATVLKQAGASNVEALTFAYKPKD